MFCETDVAVPMSGVTNSVSHTAPCPSLVPRYAGLKPGPDYPPPSYEAALAPGLLDL